MIRRLLLFACAACVALLGACRQAPSAGAPTLAHDGEPVLALAPGPAGEPMLAVHPGGATSWLSPDGARTPGPRLPDGTERAVQIDLTGDGAAEIVAAGPGAVAALSADGTSLWRAEVPAAPLLDMAAAPIGPDGAARIALAGLPPLSLTVLDADGTVAWTAPQLRSAVAVAPLAQAEGGEGLLLAADDGGLVHRFTADGEPRAAIKLPIVPRDLAVFGGQLLAVGRPTDADLDTATVVLAQPNGSVVWQVDTGLMPLRNRDVLAVLDADTAAAVPRDGTVHWLNSSGRTRESSATDAAVLAVAAGDRLWLGTALGVVQVGR